MSQPFARSLLSLRRDGQRRSFLGVAVAALLLLAWSGWFFFGELRVYESTPVARLEVVEPLVRIGAPVAGPIAALHVRLNDEVTEGQLLARIESRPERLALEEAEVRVLALRAQLAPLGAQIEATESSLGQGQRSVREAVREASAEQRAREAEAAFERERSERITRLAIGGSAAEAERSEAQASATRARSSAEAAAFAVERERWERLLQTTDVRARLEGLRRERARIEGEIRGAEAGVARLREQLERREIRAPCAGRVAEIGDLSAGALVAEGERLLSLLPRGELHAVAYFTPATAFGRIRPEQRAEMRLDAFPWTRFGVLTARVSRVADERSEEGVRVELALLHPEGFAAPLDHGMPGTLEVEVEALSPFELVLRSAGGLLEGGG